MAKAKKMLSAVLAALMVVFTVASYVPAKAATAGPKNLVIQQEPQEEYKVGDRVLVKFNAPEYKGIVQYRAFLWNRTTQKFVQEIYKDYPGYWYKPVCVGTSHFTIDVFYPQEPGVYYIGVLVKAKGAKTYSTYKYTKTFTVVAKDAKISEIAAQEATVDQGAEYKLPAQVEAKMADNTTKMVDVKWDAEKVDTTKAGEQKFVGKVEGYDKDVELKLTVKEVELKVESVSAIKATTLKVTFNKAVDTAKTSFVVKKSSIALNVSKIAWAEDKKSAELTMMTKLSKGDYTVAVSTETEKNVTGIATVDNEKVAKIELTSDKLVLTNDTNTEAKVGYVIYNQYGEDVISNTSLYNINWNIAPSTSKDATKGVLTIGNDAKFALDQKVVVTALEQNNGIFMSQTVTVSRKAYVNEVSVGEIKSDDDKITTLNLANVKHFYFPVVLKDQYGNVIKSTAVANSDLLTIKSNVGGAFANDEDGNLIFKLDTVDKIAAGNATVTFVTMNSGARATKEITLIANPAIADFSMELPELIAAGDEDVAVKYTAVDQFGNEVKDLAQLNTLIGSLGVSGASLTNGNFKFTKDVITGAISLTLDASEATAGRVFITLVTPSNKVYTTNFEVKDARKAVLVSGINNKLISNFVIGSTGAIKASDINIVDQYGKVSTLKDLSGVTVSLKSSDENIATVATTLAGGADNSAAVTPIAKGTVVVTATINGVADSANTFRLNVVEAKDVVNYEVADIATLNGNTGAVADVVVTGKLADGSSVVLNNNVIKSILTSNTDIITIPEGTQTVKATTQAETTPDATAKVIVTIEGANGPVVIAKDVKVSYKKATPTKIEVNAKNSSIVNGVAYVASTITDEDLAKLFVVTDQYGAVDTTSTITIVKTNVTTEGCNVIAIVNGLSVQLKVVYTK